MKKTTKKVISKEAQLKKDVNFLRKQLWQTTNTCTVIEWRNYDLRKQVESLWQELQEKNKRIECLEDQKTDIRLDLGYQKGMIEVYERVTGTKEINIDGWECRCSDQFDCCSNCNR